MTRRDDVIRMARSIGWDFGWEMTVEQELLVAKLLGHSTVEMVRRSYGKYISQTGGIVLRGDYSKFGAYLGHSVPLKAALIQTKPKSKTA